MPLSSNFWVAQSADTVGGVPLSGGNSTFAIPNLLYDYVDIHLQNLGYSDPVTIIKDLDITHSGIADQQFGLYSQSQFRAFATRAFPNGTSAVLSADEVYQAIDNIRSPTCYDALNYLIPHQNTGGEDLDSVGMVPNNTPVSPSGAVRI